MRNFIILETGVDIVANTQDVLKLQDCCEENS